ncbi:MAG: hypothetical protein JJU02_02305 [Cryomorphaceae bacterium]|nr:hypothetical protein [Cryomorphaceae bacterium]
MKTKVTHLARRFSLALGIGFIFSSCIGDSEFSYDRENAFVAPYLKIEAAMIHQVMLFDAIMRDSLFQQTGTTRIYNDIHAQQSGDTLSISYGQAGVGSTNPDGVNRRGGFIIATNGDYDNLGSEFTFIYKNLRIEDKLITGGFTMENMGLDSLNKEYFSIITDSIFYDGDNKYFTSTREVHWMSDFDLSTPKGNREVFFMDPGVIYYNGFTNNGAVVSCMGEDVIVFDETCTYRVVNGIYTFVNNRSQSGSDEFTADMIEESDCSSIIRIQTFNPNKGSFFFLPKEGF